jgi:hypothetical protein
VCGDFTKKIVECTSTARAALNGREKICWLVSLSRHLIFTSVCVHKMIQYIGFYTHLFTWANGYKNGNQEGSKDLSMRILSNLCPKKYVCVCMSEEE